MATALPDKAWGRESAVYRVSGVLTVIGGWFLTAFLAAATAGMVAIIIYYGGIAAMIGMLALSAFIIYRSTSFHKKREKEIETEQADLISEATTPEEAKQKLLADIGGYILSASEAVILNTKGLFTEDRAVLKDAKRIAKTMDKQCKAMTSKMIYTRKMESDETEFDQPLANALGALQRMSSMVKNLTYQSYVHIDNNHNVFNQLQAAELRQLDDKLQSILSIASTLFADATGATLDDLHAEVSTFKELSRKFDKNQLKRTKKEKYPSRTSLLFFEILSDTNGIVDNLLILLHAAETFEPEKQSTESL
jgi:Na+/phosphate symporter